MFKISNYGCHNVSQGFHIISIIDKDGMKFFDNSWEQRDQLTANFSHICRDQETGRTQTQKPYLLCDLSGHEFPLTLSLSMTWNKYDTYNCELLTSYDITCLHEQCHHLSTRTWNTKHRHALKANLNTCTRTDRFRARMRRNSKEKKALYIISWLTPHLACFRADMEIITGSFFNFLNVEDPTKHRSSFVKNNEKIESAAFFSFQCK